MQHGKASASAIDPSWAAAVGELLFLDDRDALLLTDGQERVIAVNAEWLMLCGGGAEPMVGTSFADIAGNAQASEVADLLRRARSEGRPVEALITLRHRHGFALRLTALITPIAAPDRAASAYLVRLRPASLHPR